MRQAVVTAILFVACLCDMPFGHAADAVDWLNRPFVRRPIAIVGRGDQLWIANRNSGTVSCLDAAAQTVLAEVAVGSELSELIAVDARRKLLALDRKQHQAVVMSADVPPRVVTRIDVAQHPVSAVESQDGATISVASLWSRRITLLKAQTTPEFELRISATIDLPFAPLKQLVLDERHVLVADAFGGQLAIIDLPAARVKSWWQLNGHNLRGMTLNHDRREVLLTHQLLLQLGETTPGHISWGGVVSNMLHTLPIKKLLAVSNFDPARPDRIHGSMLPLGERERAAGDPSEIQVTEKGDALILLSGVHELGLLKRGDQQLTRVAVGQRPTAFYRDDHQRLHIVNTNDDSITQVDADSLTRSGAISLGPRVVKSSEQAGEDLFYDARLSLDGWFSCHSCHGDGHTNGLLNDNFGDNSFGTPKRVLSLLGTGLSEPWAWNGSQTDLRSQIAKSVEMTMAGPSKRGPPFGEAELESLTTFVALLPPAPSLSSARKIDMRPARERGRAVFEKQGCSKCHQAPSYASPLRFQVGFEDEAGWVEFNPPSLVGVSQRGPYLHDNRAKQLRDVFEQHDHADAADLDSSDIDDLLVFLNSL